ncbi:hypothetical protein GIB67_027254, partial [Kingdonia uniflora]
HVVTLEADTLFVWFGPLETAPAFVFKLVTTSTGVTVSFPFTPDQQLLSVFLLFNTKPQFSGTTSCEDTFFRPSRLKILLKNSFLFFGLGETSAFVSESSMSSNP